MNLTATHQRTDPADTLLSLGGPLSGRGVTGIDREVLITLHLTRASVHVPLMRRTIAGQIEAL